jgi:hypothetical protein
MLYRLSLFIDTIVPEKKEGTDKNHPSVLSFAKRYTAQPGQKRRS